MESQAPEEAEYEEGLTEEEWNRRMAHMDATLVENQKVLEEIREREASIKRIVSEKETTQRKEGGKGQAAGGQTVEGQAVGGQTVGGQASQGTEVVPTSAGRAAGTSLGVQRVGNQKPSTSGGNETYPLNASLSSYLQTNQYPAGVTTKSQKTSLRKTAKNYYWQDGKLYKVLSGEQHRNVPPTSMIPQIFRWCHDMGHLGQRGTYDRVRQTYWWEGMKETCYAYVKSCEACQKAHDTSIRTDREMHPVSVQGLLPFQKVAIDLAGPLQKTGRGFRFVLVVVCYITKWVEIFPLQDDLAVTCAEVFVQEIIARYGCPLELVSDNGHSFDAAFAVCMKHWGILNLRIAAYHPQSNGLVERCIQTMKHALSRLVGTQATTWDSCLAWMLMAYRNSVQKSTGYSPHFLLFGRDAIMPEQLTLLTGSLVMDENESLEQYLQELLSLTHRIQDTLIQAQQNVGESQDRQREDFANRKKTQATRVAKVRELEPGALLLAKKPNTHVLGLGQSWRGPYELLHFVSPAKRSVVLKELRTGKVIRRAVAQLKPFVARPSSNPASSL
jgi:hypothetical protein